MKEVYPFYMYDNGFMTNTFAQIRRFEKDSQETVHSRELVTLPA